MNSVLHEGFLHMLRGTQTISDQEFSALDSPL